MLDAHIESILFYKGEPVSETELARLFGVSIPEIQDALAVLGERLIGRGIELVRKDGEAVLVSAAASSAFLEALAQEEEIRPLGSAALETLTLALYRGPLSRSEIDFIRGVNSQYIVRNLLVRGLIEKVSQAGGRIVYRPTLNLLCHLGVASLEELPDYAAIREELRHFEAAEHDGTQ